MLTYITAHAVCGGTARGVPFFFVFTVENSGKAARKVGEYNINQQKTVNAGYQLSEYMPRNPEC